MALTKNRKAALAKIDRDTLYPPSVAMQLVKDTATTKFDPTVDIAVRLGVDPRKADQMVRGTVSLPHGTGKVARVLVFATGERAEAARAAGADHVGEDDLIERIQGGWTDFDAVVATPELMGKVGRLTREQVREIATTKQPDLNANDVEAAMKIVEGTARSMGVTIS